MTATLKVSFTINPDYPDPQIEAAIWEWLEPTGSCAEVRAYDDSERVVTEIMIDTVTIEGIL